MIQGPSASPRLNSYVLWMGGVLLGGLVVGLLVVRGQTAFTRGVFQFDESSYLLESQTFRDALKQAPQLLTHKLSLADFKKEQMQKGNLFPPGTAKPFFYLFLILFACLPLPFIASGNLLSLVSIVLASWVFYKSAQALETSPLDSLLLAVLLFASPIFSYYGVSSMAHALATAMIFLSFGAILKGQFNLAGLFMGLTLTTHYGTLPLTGLTLLWTFTEIFLSPESKTNPFQRSIRCLLLFLSPLLVFEGFYQVVKWGFAPYWKDISFLTYVEQFARQIVINAPVVPFGAASLSHNGQVFRSFFRTQGLALSGLMGTCLIYAWLRWNALPRRFKGLLIVNTLVLLFWFLNPGFFVSRVAMFLLPGQFLIMAVVLRLIQSEPYYNKRAVQSLLVVLILSSSYQTWRVCRSLRSPYPVALHYIRDQGYQGPVVDPTNILTWQFYVGRRVDFEKGYRLSLKVVQNQMMTILQAPNAAPRVAFFFRDQWPAERFDPALGDFLKSLAKRPPDHTWTIAPSECELYRYDCDYADPSMTENLNLYWLSKNSFHGTSR